MIARKSLYLIFTTAILFLFSSGAAPSIAFSQTTAFVGDGIQPGQIGLPIVFNNYSAPSEWWRPPPNTTWHWQLSDRPIDIPFEVDMYDINLFENSAAVVNSLHAQGRVAV